MSFPDKGESPESAGKRRKRVSRPSSQYCSDVVDLTSPDIINNSNNRKKRGRDDLDGKAYAFASDNIDAAAAAGSRPPRDNSKRRRRAVPGPPLATSAGKSNNGHDEKVICLLDDSSDDDASGHKSDGGQKGRKSEDNQGSTRRMPVAAAAAAAAAAVDLMSPPRTVTTVGAARIANRAGSTAVTEAAASSFAAAAAAAAAVPSPFATSAPEYLDSVKDSLCHEKKREHFDDARRPEQLLRQEITYLRDQQRYIPDGRSEEWQICQQEIDALQSELDETRKNAAQDIFNRNNSAGTMGRVDADGRLCVDFHGLYVADGTAKYEEMVLPILPVQKDVAIITGKGRHSGNGRSVLRDGLMEHIRRSAEYREGKIQCNIDPRNDGRLILRWKEGR